MQSLVKTHKHVSLLLLVDTFTNEMNVESDRGIHKCDWGMIQIKKFGSLSNPNITLNLKCDHGQFQIKSLILIGHKCIKMHACHIILTIFYVIWAATH